MTCLVWRIILVTFIFFFSIKYNAFIFSHNLTNNYFKKHLVFFELLGGLTGGHYTAACRSTMSSKDGSEEGLKYISPGIWRLNPTWLHYDDDIVEDISSEEVVSDSAYVLFYRRRRFSTGNIVSVAKENYNLK